MKKKSFLSAEEAWDIISRMGWSKNADYNEIARVWFEKIGKSGMKQLKSFVNDRVYDLYDAVERYEKENNGVPLDITSDDGFSDLRYHIVGLGQSIFDKAMVDPIQMEARFQVGDYKESFSYVFLEPEPPRTEEDKEKSREALLKQLDEVQNDIHFLSSKLDSLKMKMMSLRGVIGIVVHDNQK